MTTLASIPMAASHSNIKRGPHREGFPFETSSRLTHRRGSHKRLPQYSGRSSPKVPTVTGIPMPASESNMKRGPNGEGSRSRLFRASLTDEAPT